MAHTGTYLTCRRHVTDICLKFFLLIQYCDNLVTGKWHGWFKDEREIDEEHESGEKWDVEVCVWVVRICFHVLCQRLGSAKTELHCFYPIEVTAFCSVFLSSLPR